MATRTAKLRIELDGEREYKQALSELNKGNQVLASEMRKLSEEYRGSEHSMEALSARSDLLERELQQQKDKVELLRSALSNAAQQYGEADRRTQDWQIKLNDAEAAQRKLERQIDETNREIEEQGQATDEASGKMMTLGDAVNEIAGKLGISIPEGAKEAMGGLDQFSVSGVAAAGAVAAGIAAAAGAIRELYEVAAESARKVDELNERALKTGLGTDLLQQLDYAQLFLDFDNLDQTLVKLTQNMDKAREGADAQSEAFDKLGVSVVNEDGTLRDNWETFLNVIDALGQVENETERDALANDILGRSYSDMKPLVDAGTDALQDYMKKAEELGIVLDEEQIAKLQVLSDTIEDNKARWSALKDRLSLLVAPMFSEVISWIDEAITALTRLADAIASVDWGKMWVANNSQENNWGLGFGSISRNAGGTENWRGGLTWVGEAGPELVALPRGSQVMSAQESREIGGQNIVINVQGIQQLDEIVRWYDSRRIRGRMM